MPPLVAGLGAVGSGLLSAGSAVGGAVGSGLSALGGGSALAGGLNLAGALAPLAGALGGGGGGGGKSKISGFADPVSPQLARLLGVKLTPAGYDQSKNNPGIFGLRSQDLIDSTRDFAFNPIPVSGAETDLINSVLGGSQATLNQALAGLGGAQNQLGQVQQGLQGFQNGGNAAQINAELLNTGYGANIDPLLLQTGYNIDATPLYNTAVDDFVRNILPQIAERSGAGVASQGFGDTASREATNLLNEAARQNVFLADAAAGRRTQGALAQGELDNSAAARRAQAQIQQALLGDAGQNRALQALGLGLQSVPIQSQLALAGAALPFGLAGDALGLGNAYRNTIEAQRARPLQTFLSLAGLNPGASFVQQGYNPQGSGTADILGALAQGAGSIGNLLTPPRTPIAT